MGTGMQQTQDQGMLRKVRIEEEAIEVIKTQKSQNETGSSPQRQCISRTGMSLWHHTTSSQTAELRRPSPSEVTQPTSCPGHTSKCAKDLHQRNPVRHSHRSTQSLGPAQCKAPTLMQSLKHHAAPQAAPVAAALPTTTT